MEQHGAINASIATQMHSHSAHFTLFFLQHPPLYEAWAQLEVEQHELMHRLQLRRRRRAVQMSEQAREGGGVIGSLGSVRGSVSGRSLDSLSSLDGDEMASVPLQFLQQIQQTQQSQQLDSRQQQQPQQQQSQQQQQLNSGQFMGLRGLELVDALRAEAEAMSVLRARLGKQRLR